MKDIDSSEYGYEQEISFKNVLSGSKYYIGCDRHLFIIFRE